MNKKTKGMLTITEAYDAIAKEEREEDAKWEDRALDAEYGLQRALAECQVLVKEVEALRGIAIESRRHLLDIVDHKARQSENEARLLREIAKLKKRLAKCMPKGGIEARP